MHVVLGNGPWMVKNVVLALVPLALAYGLFAPGRRRLTPAWWVGAAAFLAFLPNGPYVMTDLFHLPGDLATIGGQRSASALVLVEYGVLLTIGLGAYAGSLEMLRGFLVRRGVPARTVWVAQVVLHGACAVGVLLGRFARFNSWDLGLRPGAVGAHLQSRLDDVTSWKLLLFTFVVLVVATEIARGGGRVLYMTADRLLRGPTDRP